ncbi:MAG: ClpX C4-type zinc finger protein [Candidatus Thiodiazotropha sp. (ex Monitilora ramsayi)]|nr:ClpX C4-type zinc finger protein [Candidatus Thiodiazotropha sp. (ex Monitilora ramsayi)]
MKKAYKVRIGLDELVVPVGELDSVQLCVDCGRDGGVPQITIGGYNSIQSDRSMETKIWLIKELEVGDSFNFEFTESEEFTPPEKEEVEGPFEERCNFCGKSKKNVDVLLEGSAYIAVYICNSCVTDCSKKIIAERANRS